MKLYLIVTSNFKCLLGKTVYTVYITKEIFISCQHSGNADQENLLQNLLNELIKWRILSDMVVIQGSKGVGRGGGVENLPPKNFLGLCDVNKWFDERGIKFFFFCFNYLMKKDEEFLEFKNIFLVESYIHQFACTYMLGL